MRKVGDDISDAVSERIRRVINLYDKRRAADDRDMTSHVVIRSEPEINLLTRSKDTELNTDLGLASLCEQIETYKDVLGTADSVTFARSSKDEDWQLLYIETLSGNVIATTECYERTSIDYNMLGGAVPICLCLKHKTTGAERHYKASARFKKIDDSGHFETLIKPISEDFEEWDLVTEVDPKIRTGG